MGNGNSQFQDILPTFVTQVLSEEPATTLISEEIQTLTYDKFLSILGELNAISKSCLDSNGKQLIFAVKKDTDSTIFWKATVQIACVKVEPDSQKIESYRLLNLNQILKVFKTLKCQSSAAEQSTANDLTVSTVLNSFDSVSDQSSGECCICFERKQELILPCAHSFCMQCIEEWNENHDTCPICREKLESTDDTWLLSEVPNAEEISKEIQENLTELTEERTPPCTPS